MEFIHPYWLFGLLAIAIPIIIHLFNFRRYRKYYFTNLKFLKSIKKETKKQSRLRHLLILLARILAIVSLVLAFARPYFPGPQGLQKTDVAMVCIYLDNSLSMQASISGHMLLDDAITKAAGVVDAYGPSDRFQLITNDFEGKHQQFYNKDELLKLLNEIQVSPRMKMLSDVFQRQQELAPDLIKEKLHFYIISDFQRSSIDFEALDEDTAKLVFLMPLMDAGYENVYIDSCWFATPFNHLNQHQELYVSLMNASGTDLEKIPIRLLINGGQRAIATFDIQAGSRAEVRLPFTNREAGFQSGLLSIDDYPITWDDRMYLSWAVKDIIPVLAIYEDSPGFYLSSLFSNDSVFYFKAVELRKLDYSIFSGFDLIVLDNINRISTGLAAELQRYIGSGGSLLLIPGMDAELSSINTFLTQMNSGQLMPYDTSGLQVTGINATHEIFNDVFETIPEKIDLPAVFGHYPFRNFRNTYSDVILELQNGDPLISVSRNRKGKLYVITSPAGDESGNLIRHALWVPLMYRMAMLSRPQERLFYTMGEQSMISIDRINISGDQSLLVKLSGSSFEFIPGQRSNVETTDLFFYDQIREAGIYELIVSGKQLIGFAFNYNRKESNPEIISPDELIEYISALNMDNIFMLDARVKPVKQLITEFNKGVELWKIFIWLALLFLLIEIILLRIPWGRK
ncbi:MAG: BatA domain-containing protein [Bacteroidales bacterium]|nr:BatA domain-containing protein [Bacteroidales bacterium]